MDRATYFVSHIVLVGVNAAAYWFVEEFRQAAPDMEVMTVLLWLYTMPILTAFWLFCIITSRLASYTGTKDGFLNTALCAVFALIPLYMPIFIPIWAPTVLIVWLAGFILPSCNEPGIENES